MRITRRYGLQHVGLRGFWAHRPPGSLSWFFANILIMFMIVRVMASDDSPGHIANKRPDFSGYSTSAAPWHSATYPSKKDRDNLRRFQRFPPTTFASGGRLPFVERVVDALSSDEDPTSNLVVALQCRDGLVVAYTSTIPLSVGQFVSTHTNQENARNMATSNAKTNPIHPTSRLLWLDGPEAGNDRDEKTREAAPWSHSSSCVARVLLEENENLLVITAGNAVHNLGQRHLIQRLTESIFVANDDGIFVAPTPQSQIQGKGSSVAALARRLADQFQKPTQSSNSKAPRMFVSCALIVGADEGIWQIDPTGQLWLSQVAVVGHGAQKARSYLLEKVAKGTAVEEEGTADTETSQTNLQSFLKDLSVEDAIILAAECIRNSIGKSLQPAVATAGKIGSNNITDAEPSPMSQSPVLALSVRKSSGGQNELCWYSQQDIDSALEAAGKEKREPWSAD